MGFLVAIRKSAAAFTAENPILGVNEIGIETDIRNGEETDTGKAKLGNGYTRWNDFAEYYIKPSETAIGGAITNGTEGSVLFVDANGNLAENNPNLNYNDTTNNLYANNIRVVESVLGDSIRFGTTAITSGISGNKDYIMFSGNGYATDVAIFLGGLNLGSNKKVAFTNGLNDPVAPIDTAIERQAAGIVKIADGSTGFGAISFKQYKQTLAKTADYTVLAADSNTLFTNTGAAGAVIFTLPDSSGCTALVTRFTFFGRAAQPITVAPAGSDHLYGWSDKTGAPFDATNAFPLSTASGIGEAISILFIGGTTWITESITGSWE